MDEKSPAVPSVQRDFLCFQRSQLWKEPAKNKRITLCIRRYRNTYSITIMVHTCIGEVHGWTATW